MRKIKLFNYATVIVTFNRKEKLINAVNAVINQQEQPQHIIIVDNHSTDGTFDALQQAGLTPDQDDKIIYKHLDKNVGGAGGFKEGMKIALSFSDVDWVAVSDDDANYAPDFFQRIANASRQHTDVKAFSGTVLGDGHIQGHRKRVNNYNTFRESYVMDDEYSNDFYYDLFTFVGVVIAKEVIKKIGLPRADFFIWYDDSEFAIRVREQTRVLNVSAAIISHPDETNGKRRATWKDYYGFRNETVSRELHAKNRFVGNCYSLFYLFAKSLAALIKSIHKGDRVYLVKSYFDGYRDAKRGRMGLSSKYLPGSR